MERAGYRRFGLFDSAGSRCDCAGEWRNNADVSMLRATSRRSGTCDADDD